MNIAGNSVASSCARSERPSDGLERRPMTETEDVRKKLLHASEALQNDDIDDAEGQIKNALSKVRQLRGEGQ